MGTQDRYERKSSIRRVPLLAHRILPVVRVIKWRGSVMFLAQSMAVLLGFASDVEGLPRTMCLVALALHLSQILSCAGTEARLPAGLRTAIALVGGTSGFLGLSHLV
jgi:hypothetical protein